MESKIKHPIQTFKAVPPWVGLGVKGVNGLSFEVISISGRVYVLNSED